MKVGMIFRKVRHLRVVPYGGIGALLVLLVTCVIYPIRFPNVKHYTIIPPTEISDDLHTCLFIKSDVSEKEVPFCRKVAPGINHSQNVPTVVDEGFLTNVARGLLLGGKWSPSHCIPLQKVTVIVPYRDRLEQLKLFLQYMHPFLQSQELDYTIAVIEQTESEDFNRGMLFNIGFNELTNDSNICCFIFHDVDLFPESSRNIYGCSRNPRHMSSSVDIFRYTLPYPELFGGVVSFTKSQFTRINGYSNLYFGWGAEDDDLFNRVNFYGMDVVRWDWKTSRYRMLSHPKSTPNPLRFQLLGNSYERMSTDGLNSLRYKVVLQTLEPLYTHYLVDVT